MTQVSNRQLLGVARDELAGLDLACWCPAWLPCHADVLLAIANPALDVPRPWPVATTQKETNG